ncbi:hypothetical protein [Collimonas silvisoli]|uniref:hypothetical protein n=1 Tax=Collimonas silvisoli TaxID=2825884 RepID=UPI001B8DA810|nr:hypothetical protein [Collimonas silvisoli]
MITRLPIEVALKKTLSRLAEEALPDVAWVGHAAYCFNAAADSGNADSFINFSVAAIVATLKKL